MKRCVVVTGGTRGIGRAIAMAYAAAGDQVYAVARHPAKDLPPGLRYIRGDATDPSSIGRAANRAARQSNGIDVWINNAGGGKPLAFGEDPESWRAIFELNFWSAVQGSRAALPFLRRPGGVVINIASLAGMMAPPGHSAYATAKAAVIALTRSLAVEFAEAGLRFNAIAPGAVGKGSSLLGTARPIAAEEVAEACLFVSSRMPSLNGHTLILDGAARAGGSYAAKLLPGLTSTPE